MKKGLIVLLLLVTIDESQTLPWSYDRQWVGFTNYEGSGKAFFDDMVNKAIKGNRGSDIRIIERLSNKQKNILEYGLRQYGLRQYTVRTNDVYYVCYFNTPQPQAEIFFIYVIITAVTSYGGFEYSFVCFHKYY